MTGYVKEEFVQPKKKFRLPLFSICYGAVVLVWAIVCTVFLVTDVLSRNSGTLSNQMLQPEAFSVVDLEIQPDGTYLSVSEDPQMILDVSGQQVRTVRLKATYAKNGDADDPYEVGLYYVAPGEVDEAGNFLFGEHKWVRPVRLEDGSYLFTLPRTQVAAIRLDPASREIAVDFEEIQINQPASWLSYYNPGWAGLTMLLVLPALLTAGLRWLLDAGWYIYAQITSRKWQREKEAEIEKNRQQNAE